jgi:excisionase family DNA binding protein
MTDDERWLTVTEAAYLAGVSRATINGWIRGGRLPATRIGRRRHIRPTDLNQAQAAAHLGMVVPAWRADRRRSGRRLRALREAAGLSQLALATTSGLTHEELSRLERGGRAPSPETIRKLSLALGVPPERFTDRTRLGLVMLTTAETAARLDVPVGRIQTWLRQGALAGTKVSGQWRVPAVAVRELGRSGRLRGVSRRLDPRYRG